MSKSQGLSLLDIAPASEQVEIGEASVTVYGVTVTQIIKLMERFPALQNWATSGEMDAKQLIDIAPGAIAAIIAAGCKVEGEEGEAKAISLSIETQMDIVEAIGRLTFKNGFGPFAQRLVRLATAGNEVVSLSSGRAQATKSQTPSSNSQPSGADPVTSGA